jgi:hypothetical protein
MEDPYKVLGLTPGASADDISRAYRTLVRRYPPELNPERFGRIQQAHELLRSFERQMSAVWQDPAGALDGLFAPGRVTVKAAEEAQPEPLRRQDVEPLLRSLRSCLLARILRDAWPDIPGS